MKYLHALKIAKRFNRCTRYESTSAQAVVEDDRWLEAVLPTESFLTQYVRNPVNKQQLSNRMTELQVGDMFAC